MRPDRDGLASNAICCVAAIYRCLRTLDRNIDDSQRKR